MGRTVCILTFSYVARSAHEEMHFEMQQRNIRDIAWDNWHALFSKLSPNPNCCPPIPTVVWWLYALATFSVEVDAIRCAINFKHPPNVWAMHRCDMVCDELGASMTLWGLRQNQKNRKKKSLNGVWWRTYHHLLKNNKYAYECDILSHQA